MKKFSVFLSPQIQRRIEFDFAFRICEGFKAALEFPAKLITVGITEGGVSTEEATQRWGGRTCVFFATGYKRYNDLVFATRKASRVEARIAIHPSPHFLEITVRWYREKEKKPIFTFCFTVSEDSEDVQPIWGDGGVNVTV